MDVHDIRYLQDDTDADPEGDSGQTGLDFKKKKNLYLAIGIVTILVLSTTSILISSFIKNPTSTTTKAKSIGKELNPSPTITSTKISGQVACGENTDLDKCKEYFIKTDNGELYKLENITYDEIKNKVIVKDKKIELEGNVYLDDKNQKAIIVTKNLNSETKTYESPKYGLKPTNAPTPTEIPHFKDSTPDPGLEYYTISEIREKQVELIDKEINVGAYLVGGYIGVDGCLIELICDYSVFILADSDDPARNTSLDMNMHAQSSEKEEDYTTGQNYYHKVKVLLENEILRLDKVY